MNKKYITEKELAAIVGRSPQSLNNDRCKKIGFPYIKFGRSVRYDLDEVIALMEKGKVKTKER